LEGRRNSYGEEIRNFCEVVLDGASMAATPDFALGELRTALALYASIRSGRWEKVW
jgi:predicted dehydrogenase